MREFRSVAVTSKSFTEYEGNANLQLILSFLKDGWLVIVFLLHLSSLKYTNSIFHTNRRISVFINMSHHEGTAGL